MKMKNVKYFAIALILLCCLMGAASAAEDISTDVVSDSVDDVVVDAVSEEIDDSSAIDETEPTVSDDTTIEEINEDIKTDEISEESATVDSEPTRATNVNANNWNLLETYSELSGTDYIITLTGTNYNPTSQINFKNSATIIGTSTSYITAGTYTGIPFLNTNSALTITFKNVKFRNMQVSNLLQLAGTNVLENCSFYNITAGTGHNAVIYNSQGTMNITDCNVTDSSAGYGVVSNYIFGSVTGVVMNVNNCKFTNNYASSEPGAINNCGILNVNGSEFINNTAALWAGAIHTHSNAQSVINNSNFTGNDAGWNGGALYTYSLLEVYNSIFKENKCHTSAGGGAIGCSNYGSTYNVTICNCTFIDNENLCGNTNETPSTGTGGAISAMNNGILRVCGSTFVNNVAAFGQAIAAYSQGYISPEGNITEGIPKVIVCNNNFTNHTLTSSDTVELSGDYTFENNTFNNCHQTNLGTNNVFNNPVTLFTSNDFVSEKINDKFLKSTSSSNMLTAEESDVIHINASSNNNPLEVDGKTWETAYGNGFIDINFAFNLATSYINDNGIIYLADGSYSSESLSSPKNITFIGQSKDTIINITSDIYEAGESNALYKFINLTIIGNDFGRNSNFINCTFLSFVTIEKNIQDYLDQGIINQVQLDESGYAKTYFMSFDNCEFKNINSENSIITLYRYAQAKFTNCTFEDITADSIIGKNGDFIDQDGIYLYDCKFTNCNVKGVVDIPGNVEIADYCAIENCDYDFDATYAHNYLNATKLKVVAVDSAVDISSSEKGVVVIALTDGANPIAGATVKYTVNGGEEQTVTTGEDGKATVSGLTGEVTIAVNYEGNESFNGISDSKFFNFTEEPVVPPKVATKITYL